MKKIFLLFVLTALVALYACNFFKEPNSTYQLEILYDISESEPLNTPDITSLFQEYREQHLYNQLNVNLSAISDISHAKEYTYHLPAVSALLDNEYSRQDSLARIVTEIEENIVELKKQSGKSHSVIFDKVYEQMVTLSHATAITRKLIVISNLHQNDAFNGYKHRDMVLQHPERVAEILMKDKKPISGKGIEISIYFEPSGFEDDKLFNSYVKIYQFIFQDATIKVQSP